MGFTKILFFQCLILAAVHLLMAEDDNGFFGPSGTFEDSGDQNVTDEGDSQSRLFFSSLFSTLTTCNSTTQAGRSCVGCSQALTCFNNNVGILRTCHGFFRYCNNGSCSLFLAANCTNSTG